MVVVLVLVLVLAWIVMFATKGDTDSAYPAHPERVAEGKPAVYYQHLGTMTASSDFVVKGEVLSASPGKELRYEASEGRTETQRNLRVRIDAVIYNPEQVVVPATVEMIEGWWAKGVGYAWEGMPWATTGDAAYFYLTAQDASPAGPYSYVSDFGRVLVDAHGRGPSGDHHGGPWQRLGEQPERGVVEDTVRKAADAAQSGAARPARKPQQFQEQGAGNGAVAAASSPH